MKATRTELKHITGGEAYQLYWVQVYKCRSRLWSIMAIDLNLEIITDADHSILAYRHDLPDDMQWMVINAGQWQIVEVGNLSPELLVEVRNLLVGLRFEINQN